MVCSVRGLGSIPLSYSRVELIATILFSGSVVQTPTGSGGPAACGTGCQVLWGFADPLPADTGRNAPAFKFHWLHFALLCLVLQIEFQFNPLLCRLVKAGNSENLKSRTRRHDTLRNSSWLSGCCKLVETVPLKERSFQNRRHSCSLQGKWLTLTSDAVLFLPHTSTEDRSDHHFLFKFTSGVCFP